MKLFRIKEGFFLVVILLTIFSCSKMEDSFQKFIQDGERIYTGKVDSAKALAGLNRVMIEGILAPDPKVVEVRIYWNNEKDSLVVPVEKTDETDTLRIIIDGLSEGTKSFVLRTYDKDNNSSVPVNVVGNVYGEEYISSLSNRPIISAQLPASEPNAEIVFGRMDPSSGVFASQIIYEDNDGLYDTLLVSIDNDQVVLDDFLLGSYFRYRSLFLPEENALDTFYTDFVDHSVRADVTSIYLSNTGPGFVAEEGAGRWGTLAAPWITNDVAKNKDGGTHGGYTSDSRWGYNGQINWETWGNTPVMDGKVFQVSSSQLPAGDYTVTFQDYSEIQSNSSVYCIVAKGEEGIPSLPDLDQAVGYSMLFNGANVGATSPNTEEIKSFNFSLEESEYISIGFLGNLRGDGDPGNYFVVGYIQLFKN